jgi:pilus assembly protein CpaB
VFSSNLPSGQLLLRPILVTAVQAATGLPIPAGKVAVTIQMCIQKAVAGFVQPGTQIAIFNTYYKAPPGSVSWSCAGTTFSKGAAFIHTRLVMNDVQVLAVGQASATGNQATATGAFSQNSSSSSQTTVMVTVAVDQQDAERVIELAESAIPYMAIVTSSSNTSPDFTFKP